MMQRFVIDEVENVLFILNLFVPKLSHKLKLIFLTAELPPDLDSEVVPVTAKVEPVLRTFKIRMLLTI